MHQFFPFSFHLVLSLVYLCVGCVSGLLGCQEPENNTSSSLEQENYKTLSTLYQKYSLLAKLAKCTLNIALKLTFSVVLFFLVF